MGYSTRNKGQIQCFWPDETDTGFYLEYSTTLSDILNQARVKWGEDIDLTKLKISPQYIHTDCLTYDCYDSSDYTNFLLIEYEQ